jgi:hypothetical protein
MRRFFGDVSPPQNPKPAHLSSDAALELFYALRQFTAKEVILTARDLYDDGSLPITRHWQDLNEFELMWEVLHELSRRLEVHDFIHLVTRGRSFEQNLHNYQKDLLSGAKDLLDQASAMAEFMALLGSQFSVEESIVAPQHQRKAS